MNDLKAELIYTKFSSEKVEVKIKKDVIGKVIQANEIYIKYLQEELTHTINPALKDDIKMITRVDEGLRRLRNNAVSEGVILITIAEFLVFKNGVKNTATLLGTLELSNPGNIEYMDFIIYLDKIYGTLNGNEVKVYYEFLASYDTPKKNVLN